MIALDTNVVVRFLVRDDEAQHEAARRLLARGPGDGEEFFLGDVVLAEVVWVLASRYRFERRVIASTLRALLEAEHVSVESTDRCLRALRRFESGRGGFADYLIAERGRDAGAATVATVDRELLAEDGFIRP